jgi:hypothetical protein
MASAQQTHDSSSRPHQHAHPAISISGAMRGQNYENSYFGFRYNVPYGWVDRTQEMGEGNDVSDDQAGSKSTSDPQPSQSRVLLAVFERPPEAVGTTINSAVVITAESASTYHGLKTAADYFGPIDEITTAKGFKVVNGPYEFSVGAKKLVRADYSKQRDTLTMQQSTLVMLHRDYVVSFTFIAGSDDEMDELIENLSFATKR